MIKFIIVMVILIYFFRALRKFISFNSQSAFNKAADDFAKRQEDIERKNQEEGKVYVDTKARINKNDKFDDYEEVK